MTNSFSLGINKIISEVLISISILNQSDKKRIGKSDSYYSVSTYDSHEISILESRS